MSAGKYVLWRERPGASDAARTPTPGNRLTFGNEVVAVGVDGGAGRADADRIAVGASASRLHLVVQVGNRFEAEHPDVLVVYRKGRYLLVDIDPQDARARTRNACYAIQPVLRSQVVYEDRARVDARARA